MRFRRHKYNAKPETVDGYRFASKAEARRYRELKLLQDSGRIQCLELQPRYPLLSADGKKICTYVADFAYVEGGSWVVEDVKGFMTAVFKLKRKLFEANYKVPVRIIT